MKRYSVKFRETSPIMRKTEKIYKSLEAFNKG